jgi:hypothetical protein
MIQLPTDLLFAVKAVEKDGVGFHLRMRDFDRDLASAVQVGGAKDRGHAAAGCYAVDAVGSGTKGWS